MTFRFPGLSLMAALAVAGCSGTKGDEASRDPVALVSVATAGTGAVTTSLTVFGTVEQNAGSQIALSVPVEATVSRIVAPIGTAVKQGQLVVFLAPSPTTRADAARISAEAQTAQQALERAQRLRKDGLASDADVEAARSAATSANAARAASATKAGQLALRAPFSGYVESIANSPGELVAAGTTLVTMARTGAMHARFRVDHSLLGRLARGRGIVVDLPSEDIDLTLPIASVDPTVDPQTRLASIYADIPAAYGLGAGQPLKGTITLEQAQSQGAAVTMPYAALLDDGGQPYVFVVTKGVAKRKDVTLGATDGKNASVTAGIKAGDQVVTKGGTALEDGMKVRTK